jgi:hypothetical protein
MRDLRMDDVRRELCYLDAFMVSAMVFESLSDDLYGCLVTRFALRVSRKGDCRGLSKVAR